MGRWFYHKFENYYVNNIFKLSQSPYSNSLTGNMEKTINLLQDKKVLVLGFSNRWQHPGGKADISKTERLGRLLAKKIGDGAKFVDVFKLKIYPCEGNISSSKGNNCGAKDSKLEDRDKNPTGHHRCWASLNNNDDELWKISKEILDSECVLFIAPVRWGQACATYQKTIERLSWLENRHTTLGEENILKDKMAGFICIGHNWNGDQVVKTQMQVLKFFGFKVKEEICWNWQWTSDAKDESADGYKEDASLFASKLTQITIKKTENE